MINNKLTIWKHLFKSAQIAILFNGMFDCSIKICLSKTVPNIN